MMSFARIIGAATSRVRGRAGRAAQPRVSAPTAGSPPDRTMLLLLALYACWASATPAMKLMVDTVPPLGGAALVFLAAGLVLAVVLGRRQAKGLAKWTYYYLYVILDVFSRYIVGWTVQYRENAQLAKALIEQTAEQQNIAP